MRPYCFKYFAAFFLFYSGAFHLQAQTFGPEPKFSFSLSEQKNLRNKSVLIYSYQFISKKKTDSTLNQLVVYDSLGFVDQASFYFQGRFRSKLDFQFENRRLQKIVETNFAIRKSILYEIEYDSLNRPNQEFNYPEDTSNLVTYKYVYGSDKRIAAIYRQINDETPEQVAQYAYENGRIKEMINYEQAQPVAAYIYEYDIPRKSKTTFEQIGRNMVKMRTEYVNNAGLTRRIVYHSKLTPGHDEAVYHYDANSYLIQVDYLNNGKLSSMAKYFYLSNQL